MTKVLGFKEVIVLIAVAAVLLGNAQLLALTQTEAAKLVAPDGETNDRFGQGVSIYGDVAVVASPLDDDDGSNSGAVYAYR